MVHSMHSGKIWKLCSSFVFLILTVTILSVAASASGTTVRTDPGRINRFTYQATTQTNHEGLRDAARSSSDSTSMLLADGRGTSSTGYIRADIHYVDRNNNGVLNFGVDDLVYCLHNRKRSPTGSQTFQILNYSQALNYMWPGWREQTVANDKVSLDGLVAILQNGFPARSAEEMGLSNNGNAYAATQMAVRFWVAERERDLRRYSWNYNYYDQSRSGFGSITALSGQHAVLTKAHSLLSIARNPPARSPAISTSLLSSNETRTQRDFFIYRYRVNLTDLSDGYSITSTSLPAGSSYTGYTGKSGDIIEVRIPFTQTNAGRSFSINLRSTDSAGVASLEFRPVPSSTNAYQGLIGINMTQVDTVRYTTWSRTTRTIADPYVHSITTNKSIYAPGESGTATIVLRNKGNRRAEASVLEVNGVRYAVSWIDPPDGSSTKSRTINASFTVPSSAGSTWNLPIKVDVDDHVLEVNEPGIGENNNNLNYPITVGRPDLDITTLSANKTIYDPGETVTITTNIRNKGTVVSSTSILTLKRNGITIDSRAVPSLGAGSNWGIQTFTFTAPSSITTTSYQVNVSIPTNQSPTGVTSRTVTITVRGRADLDITMLTTNKAVYEPGETVTVTTNIRNKGYSTSAGYIITVRQGTEIIESRNMSGLAAGASSGNQIFYFSAPVPEIDSNYVIEVSIPDNQSPTGTTSRSTSIMVLGLPDLSVISSTGQDYFTNKDVIISALIRNNHARTVPDAEVKLTFADNELSENIPVPGNSSNLAVFRVRTPAQPGQYLLTITIDPEDHIEESNTENNTLTQMITVGPELRQAMPDPDHLSLQQYYLVQGKKLPDLVVPEGQTRHNWQELRLENGSYMVKDFWMQLDTQFSIQPDPRIAIPGRPGVMESGFGLESFAETVITTNYDQPDKLIGPQMVYLFYPETEYGLEPFLHYADDLEPWSEAAGSFSNNWRFFVSQYSVSDSRLHYTPLWIPDGGYPIMAQVFYAWSPIGQIFDYKTDAVTIEGDMYERVTVVRR